MQPILVKYCRIFCGLSQTELAELIGVHQSLIAKIEKGTVPMQSITERKLLEVFSDMGMNAESILQVKQMLMNIQKEGK